MKMHRPPRLLSGKIWQVDKLPFPIKTWLASKSSRFTNLPLHRKSGIQSNIKQVIHLIYCYQLRIGSSNLLVLQFMIFMRGVEHACIIYTKWIIHFVMITISMEITEMYSSGYLFRTPLFWFFRRWQLGSNGKQNGYNVSDMLWLMACIIHHL